MSDKTHYELMIIGAGPAGMTAGVYAARKQLETIIISPDIGGQASWSSGIENYLGFRFVTGSELVQKFEDHLRQFPIRLEFAKVTKLTSLGGAFVAQTDDGREFTSRATIIASGKSPKMLGVPGEKEFAGKGVTYCATCDGPIYTGMDVAVVGGGNSGLDAAVQLMKICPKVYVIEYTDKIRADEILKDRIESADNVEILTSTEVLEITGGNFVESIRLKDRESGNIRNIRVNGVFVEIGLTPNTSFLDGLVDTNEYGEIIVDCAARTKIPGLYAGGDVTSVPEKQIIIAAGDGAKAALGAYSYLVRLPSTAFDWSKESQDV